ncbi:MAG: GntR family transcriptional regulator [Firmicutes bacterium]|nr:GntR family transcriptional regulator [Bacillota bacterium]
MLIEYRPKSLADQVYERLEESILNGEYSPGDILTEKQLSVELGVSRTPIREALSRLEYDSLVKETSQGTEVRGINEDDVKDLYDVKKNLETLAVKKAVENMTEEDIKALRDVVDQQIYFAGKGDTEKVRNLDTEFHDIIYGRCGSVTFEKILSGVHHKLKKYRRNSLKSKKRIKASVIEHEEILKAIEERNAKEAQRLMTKHLENAYKSVIASEDN